jgi:hypothetical protein
MRQMGHQERRFEVVSAYEKGGVSLRDLEQKFGVSSSTIHTACTGTLVPGNFGRECLIMDGGNHNFWVAVIHRNTQNRKMRGTWHKPVSIILQSGYGDFLVRGVVQKQGVWKVKRQKLVDRGSLFVDDWRWTFEL